MTSVKMVLETEFCGICQELGHLRVALRCDGLACLRVVCSKDLTVEDKFLAVVVETCEKTLSHETLSPECLIARFESEVCLETTEIEGSVCPDISLSYVCIVVITILIALLKHLSLTMFHIIVQVILNHCRR